MQNKSIRIRTTPGLDSNIKVELNQDFDFIEILSLKLTQKDLYESFCSDYGVVIGRVIANEGFGVPNTKVSIFIPISDEDQKNDLIRTLYPYKTVTSVNDKGTRYNLLLEKSTCSLNKPVGTFPTKETVLNNDVYLEIFDKYYKYTTTTNDAGDYIIFGVPTGQQTIHMDVDISDIGFLSLRPYDLKAQGFPENLFDGKEFKSSKNLDSLPQIKTQNKGVDVVPLWGDTERCEFGITRVDFNIGNDITPNAIFIGSIFTDSDENALQTSCRIKKRMGEQGQLITGPGEVGILRLNYNIVGSPYEIERLPVKPIDENGVYAFTLPLYYDKVITDEFGRIVRSPDQTKGISTKGRYRFKLKFDDSSVIYDGKKSHQTASLIVPSYYDSVRFTDDISSYTYNILENDVIVGQGTQDVEKDFHVFEWKQVYTTTQYIRKLKNKGAPRFDFIGLKDCGLFTMERITADDTETIGDTFTDDDQVNTNLNIPYTYAIKRPLSGLSKSKKFKLAFYDNYLNGGCYLFKFKIKQKNNGTIDFCGLNGTDNKVFCDEGDVDYDINSYTFIKGSPLGQIPPSFAGNFKRPKCTVISPKSNQLIYNGSNDTEENIYCKWALDTKIMNIGSMVMCEETLTDLKENLSTNPGNSFQEPLKLFFKPSSTANDCIGTNIEYGIRGETINPIDYLKPTTYYDLNDAFPYQMQGQVGYSDELVDKWGDKLSIFNNSDWLDECYGDKVLRGSQGGDFLKYYCRLDYPNSNQNEQAWFTANPLNPNYLNSSVNKFVGCSKNLNNNLYYSKYDHPYFYFGLIPGKTALDKLKKDFF